MRSCELRIASALAVAVGLGLCLDPSAMVLAQSPSPTPVPIPRPTPGPTPTPSPSPTDAPTVRILGSVVVPRGAIVEVEVTGGPGHRRDWIGLYAQGARDLDNLRFRFLNGSTFPPRTGVRNATVRFDMPRIPGRYEFRFFASGTHRRLATSGLVIVR
jgi:hypothetical protein